MIKFEQDCLIVKSFFPILFWKTKKIPYKKIERIEFTAGDEYIVFTMKNGKKVNVSELGLVAFYTQFGEMLKKYGIAYYSKLEDSGYEPAEKVYEEAEKTRRIVLEYANNSVRENLGDEYEVDVKLVERIIGTTLELQLLKNGSVVDAANVVDSIDGKPLLDEMDLAFLSEWDPVSNSGKYSLLEEAVNPSSCESYLAETLKDFYDNHKEEV